MDASEARARIKQSIELLEGYRGFSSMVDEAIESLKVIDGCVADPTPERMKDSRARLMKLAQDIAPYRGFVPSLSDNLDALLRMFEAET
jgi:uncharacterized protein YnzC (UPF0291/DUF896 family)